MERRNLRSSLNRHSVNDGGQDKVIENGIKEEENDQDVEGEGMTGLIVCALNTEVECLFIIIVEIIVSRCSPKQAPKKTVI